MHRWTGCTPRCHPFKTTKTYELTHVDAPLPRRHKHPTMICLYTINEYHNWLRPRLITTENSAANAVYVCVRAGRLKMGVVFRILSLSFSIKMDRASSFPLRKSFKMPWTISAKSVPYASLYSFAILASHISLKAPQWSTCTGVSDATRFIWSKTVMRFFGALRDRH